MMYIPYHVHSMLSNGVTNIDSITNFRDYIVAAKKCGMPAIGFAEHGNTFEWLHKKEEVEKAGMKYIHAAEFYLTEKISTDEDGNLVKTNDNYHCVLIAKNYNGLLELNNLESCSFNRLDGHYYYKPRITFDELFATSDNIIVTTACLGGVLFKGTESAKESLLNFLKKNRHRCFLEIQHHDVENQKIYNQLLSSLSNELKVPLIAGTDTHEIDELHMEGRTMFQIGKDVRFEGEDNWDLSFKTPKQLIVAYKKQGALPENIVLEAMQNTVVMSEMVEEFTIDRSPKYPQLYDNPEEAFKQKVNAGSKWRKIHEKPNKDEYFDRIHYEYGVYEQNGSIDFMLLEEDYKGEMRRRGIRYGYSRGSVSGSIIAYLLGSTEIDSVKYNLNFERFMNPERVSLADIDTDWYSEDKAVVREYLDNKDRIYCCDIVTFNTVALKGAIDDVCRSFFKDNYRNFPQELVKEIEKYTKRNEKLPAELKSRVNDYIENHGKHKEIPYDYLKKADEIKKLVEKNEKSARRQYKNLFKFVDLFNGVITSVGNHPSACVVAPHPIEGTIGTFTTKTNKYPVSVLNMSEIDSMKYIKLDILGLDTIGVIYKTCDAAGIPYATPDNIPGDDMNVWNSIVEDTTMIFQWESASATQYMHQLFSPTTVENIKKVNPNVSYMDLLSIGNGAIRPAGASYRDQLANGIYHDNGHEALNKFLEPTLGYLVYQEQIIEFLHSFCGYTMGEADVVRRGFAKKYGTEKFVPKIKQGFYRTMSEKYGLKQSLSEALISDFIKVIEDASAYLFSKNHADPYSWIGYICGYLRYYYPLEFITSALNVFSGKEDKTLAITEYAKKVQIKISPIKFRYSTATYNFSKETNEIYKGIESIKFMNKQVAEEMYDLRDNEYNSFTDLLFDLKEKTTLKKNQLQILIELDFFSEFGDANFLIAQNDRFDRIYGKVQFNKGKFEDEPQLLELLRKYSAKETEKMITQVDTRRLLSENVGSVQFMAQKLSDKVKLKIRHLGYLDIADEKYAGFAAVISVDTKYSPRLKLHSLKNGTSIDCKIAKRVFKDNKLQEGDIVKILRTENRPRSAKDADGNWIQLEGTNELWITRYTKVRNI